MTEIPTVTNSQIPQHAAAELRRHFDSEPRSEVLRRKWWLVLLIAIGVAGITYAISGLVPKQFSSAGTAAVNVTGGSSDPSQVATAADNLASQYAQQVSAQKVIAQATRNLGPSDARNLSVAVSGGTVADQNIVQVSAVGSSPGQAQRRAANVLAALVGYVSSTVRQESGAYSRSVQTQLQPIDRQIRSISTEISNAPSRSLNTGRYLALQQTLSTLIAQRSSSVLAIAQDASGGQPSLSVLTDPGPGAQVAPRPKLYAGVAFLLALVLVAQGMIYLTPRKQP